MKLSTDFNVTPYFDDYDENKNFHRMVFKPRMAVQARELTQLQTILQEQVSRFGENILKEGTIVKGGNFTNMPKTPYVKILDNNTLGQPVPIASYVGAIASGRNSGVRARVIHYAPGIESQSPDLNTLYLRYIDTGKDATGKDVKKFIAGEILEFTVGGVAQPELSVSVAGFGVDPNPIGVGYLVKCGDGILFQKGFFVRFENQIAIVEKYNQYPDEKVVGFYTEEEIVDYNADKTLLDNAQGFNNHNAPGADRLKLYPVLVTYTKEEAVEDENFFAIHEYSNGSLIRRNTTTQFNSINTALEQRTYEESGNYTLEPYSLDITRDSETTDYVIAQIGPGISYVGGKRIETLATTYLPIKKATDFATVTNQNVLGNYGNSILITSLVGSLSFSSMQTVALRSSVQSASTLIGFTPAGAAIGTARVISYIRDGSGFRLYLTDIKMNSGQNFASVKSVTSDTGFANVVLTSGRAVLSDTSLKQLVFPVGRDAIKEILTEDTDYTYRKTLSIEIPASGLFSVNLSGEETFPYGAGITLNSIALGDIIVSDEDSGGHRNVISASIDGSGASMNIAVNSAPQARQAVVIVNVKRNGVYPSGKTLQTVYMRINASGDVKGPYSLGWADVHSIENVWKGTTTTFAPGSAGVVDVTKSFILDKNIKPEYYDISFLKRSSKFKIQTTDRFLVKAKVFVRNDSGGYSKSFFCVNSYPVDDLSIPLPNDKIRTEDIPNGLRDAIDFRPTAVNNAAYSTTHSGATIWTTSNRLNSVSFGSDSLNIIAPNESVELSYSYYLARRDKIALTAEGDFIAVSGESAVNPVPPNEPPNSLVLADVFVPAFPSLPPAIANRKGSPENGIVFVRANNRRYTMKDIDDISKRITNLEYYTVLNALEKSAEDMTVLDADGNSRYKNGIFVENFNTLLNSYVKHPSFSASVDKSEEELAPRLRCHPIQLKVQGNPSGMKVGEVTLPIYTEKRVINQPYATNYRNTVTDFYSYKGEAAIFPEYDGSYDTSYAPDVSVDIDIAGAFSDFAENLNEIVPLTTSSTTTTRKSTNLGKKTDVSTSVSTVGNTTTTTTDTTVTKSKKITETSKTLTKTLDINSSETTQKVGDFITNIQFSPYLRSRPVKVRVVGMRPNVRVWVYFDGEHVTNHCATGQFDMKARLVKRTSKFGAKPLVTDANGNIAFVFMIPENKFYTGDRLMTIVDVDDIESSEAATTSAQVTYRGFNYSIEKTGVEVSTRVPDFDIDTERTTSKKTWVETTSKTTTSTSVETTREPRERERPEPPGPDPIAQTFWLDKSIAKGNSVMISSIEVAFEKKSSSKGVTLELREVINGYPGKKVYGFGKVRKLRTEVTTSNDGTGWTKFDFDVPVTLATSNEYCFVIKPIGNDPDYRVWIARVGEKDKSRGISITQDTNAGTLFTSTNDSAWTPYQNENMTFRVNRAVFPKSSFNVTLTPDNYEFFRISEYSSAFRKGETIYKLNPNGSGTVSVTEGSDVITGNGTSFTTYFTVGDSIAISDGTGHEIAIVKSIESNTSLTVDEFMKVSRNAIGYFKTVSGKLENAFYKEPVTFVIQGTTAKTNLLFEDGDVIRGELSESSATIEEVFDIPVSYFQPDIRKTDFKLTDSSLFLTRRGTNSGTANANEKIAFNDNSYQTDIETYIMSRSNEIRSAKDYSFSLKVNVDNSSTDEVTPYIDHDISNVNVFEYFIDENSSELIESEIDPADGDASARWISKDINLRDGFDAEDLKVWLTGYRPPGSNIDVFVKFLSSTDPESIEKNSWTRLVRNGANNFFSSAANREDWKEFEFSIDTTELGNNGGAYLKSDGSFEYKGESGAIYSNFKTFRIKIVMTARNHGLVPRVKDIRAIALT